MAPMHALWALQGGRWRAVSRGRRGGGLRSNAYGSRRGARQGPGRDSQDALPPIPGRGRDQGPAEGQVQRHPQSYPWGTQPPPGPAPGSREQKLHAPLQSPLGGTLWGFCSSWRWTRRSPYAYSHGRRAECRGGRAQGEELESLGPETPFLAARRGHPGPPVPSEGSGSSACQPASPRFAGQFAWYGRGRDYVSAPHRVARGLCGGWPSPATLGAFPRRPGVCHAPGACLGLLGAVPTQAIQGAPRPQRRVGASSSAYASQGLQGD